MAYGLKIPLALTADQRVIDPEDATSGGNFHCPLCQGKVILRKGALKRAHFAHHGSDTCSEESLTHKLAKLLIVQVTRDWLSGAGSSPQIKRNCGKCGNEKLQALPDRLTDAREEVRLDNGFVVDVGLMVGEEVAAAVEVKVSHAVPPEKKSALGIPFIEVEGHEILSDPHKWRPAITDHFRESQHCLNCDRLMEGYRRWVKEVSIATSIAIPKEPYRTAIYQCWKCEKQILYFLWPGRRKSILPPEARRLFEISRSRPLNETERARLGELVGARIPRKMTDEPPDGKPETIRVRYSKSIQGYYWANNCPYCDAMQSDYHVFKKRGPLNRFRCGGDFKSDMQRLAIRYMSNHRGYHTQPNDSGFKPGNA